MTAAELVTVCLELGVDLVGKYVDTEAIGKWPGGVAQVFAMNLDPEAPEIVFNVRHAESGKEIGVFDYEEVKLAKRP